MRQLKKIEEWRKNTIEKISLLNSIKILTKKDGSEFKVLSKNFNFPIIEECYLIPSKCLSLSTDYKLCLTHTLDGNNYDSYFDTYISSDRVIKEFMIKPYYHLTIKEIKKKIELEKISLNNYLLELEELEKKYKWYTENIPQMKFSDVIIMVENLKGSLKYLIQDYIKEELNF